MYYPLYIKYVCDRYLYSWAQHIGNQDQIKLKNAVAHNIWTSNHREQHLTDRCSLPVAAGIIWGCPMHVTLSKTDQPGDDEDEDGDQLGSSEEDLHTSGPFHACAVHEGDNA